MAENIQQITSAVLNGITHHEEVLRWARVKQESLDQIFELPSVQTQVNNLLEPIEAMVAGIPDTSLTDLASAARDKFAEVAEAGSSNTFLMDAINYSDVAVEQAGIVDAAKAALDASIGEFRAELLEMVERRYKDLASVAIEAANRAADLKAASNAASTNAMHYNEHLV